MSCLLQSHFIKRYSQDSDTILGTTRENLTGVRVIRAFHQEQAEYNKFLAENEELTSLQKFAGKISGLTNPRLLLLSTLLFWY